MSLVFAAFLATALTGSTLARLTLARSKRDSSPDEARIAETAGSHRLEGLRQPFALPDSARTSR